MLYHPFADHLDEVAPEDLARLTDVHEGWYVEYKREMIGSRELAKSLSSFANQYGGWLFFGVEQDSVNNVAAGFKGIPDTELQGALDSIRNAAKDLLNPAVFYNVRPFPGPYSFDRTRGGPFYHRSSSVGRTQLTLHSQRWSNLQASR